MTFKIVQLHKECPISTEYSDKATNTAQIFSPKKIIQTYFQVKREGCDTFEASGVESA